MIDCSIYYIEKYSTIDIVSSSNHWDYYISAFTSADRVQEIFASVQATCKHWLVFPEYQYSHMEYPKGNDGEEVFPLSGSSESEVIGAYIKEVMSEIKGKNICIDITGFIRPHMMFFLKCLKLNGIKKFDVLYAAPKWYQKRELTEFSNKVLEVRLVHGYEGIQEFNNERDLLIVGSGYDDQLISAVTNKKSSIRNKVQIFGLPSLSPIMYQENRLSAHRVSEDIRESEFYFAPAYNPFATAEIIKEIVEQNLPTNLYLCPLATKPQILGFVLYYLLERENTATSIIHPFYESYSKQTSEGVGRIWKYTIEF